MAHAAMVGGTETKVMPGLGPAAELLVSFYSHFFCFLLKNSSQNQLWAGTWVA